MKNRICIMLVSAIALTPTIVWSLDVGLGPLGHVCDTCGGGLVGGLSRNVEKLGDDTFSTFQKAGEDTIRTLQKAGGDTITTVENASGDSITTIYKAAGDATATYVKGWRDVGEQGKRSFNDAIDAGKAASRFVENQARAQLQAAKNGETRLRKGDVVGAMWGLATEPLKSDEENFAKATQESKVINAAAGTAAAVYGGPAGAAAYAAWSTYRSTGNADMALRAGVLAAITSQMGTSVAQMPAGTAGEILQKAAMAGAAGGISVAAAGGNEQAIKDGFLKSGGAVLVQGGSDELKAYSPEAKDAYDTVQCISARDVDCLSNTTWARDAKGRFLYDENGNPRIDTSKLDPKQYVGRWTGLDPQSDEGKKNAFITQMSKLPKLEAIPLLNNQWVLTSTLGKEEDIAYNMPTVVLTYVGKDAPFISTVEYSGGANSPVAPRWDPGRPFSEHPHVVAADAEGSWLPEDGYTWTINPPVPGDFRVRWDPGRASSKHPHVVATNAEESWSPEDGYTWVINPPVSGDFRVRWEPGRASSQGPHSRSASKIDPLDGDEFGRQSSPRRSWSGLRSRGERGSVRRGGVRQLGAVLEAPAVGPPGRGADSADQSAARHPA
jgi:hypothetical protein